MFLVRMKFKLKKQSCVDRKKQNIIIPPTVINETKQTSRFHVWNFLLIIMMSFVINVYTYIFIVHYNGVLYLNVLKKDGIQIHGDFATLKYAEITKFTSKLNCSINN